jgi:LysM repeat protein
MYKELLYERTGLRLVNGGCVITPHSKAYDQAYNGEVKSWLTNRFGADVFSKARSDSRKAYEAYRNDKQKQAKAQKEKPAASNEYMIQPGDTFYAIAKLHGCSVESLITANEGLDPRRLQVGQRIVLPRRPAN